MSGLYLLVGVDVVNVELFVAAALLLDELETVRLSLLSLRDDE